MLLKNGYFFLASEVKFLSDYLYAFLGKDFFGSSVNLAYDSLISQTLRTRFMFKSYDPFG